MGRIVDLEQIKIDRSLLLKIARFFSDQEGTCLLYSGSHAIVDSCSFLCLFPYDCILIHAEKQWRSSPLGDRTSLSFENPWDALQTFLKDFNKDHAYPEYIGFLGYEMGAYSDSDKRLKYTSATTPDAYFQRCAVILVVDHSTNHAKLVIADQAQSLIPEDQRKWVDQLCNIKFWPDFLVKLEEEENNPGILNSTIDCVSQDTLKTYIDKVLQAKDLIKSGDIYQVNLSQQFHFFGQRDPFAVFHNLIDLNPAQYSAYLKIKDMAIVSSSPERFLRKVDGVLETRPIKGTAPRGKNQEEDLRNKEKLLSSEKERAELLMITDLMRNDLGKISEAGSVEVVSFCDCEAYTNVYHLASTIRSKALKNLHPVQLLRACFPGGSITGCPKLSAMDIITQLEQRARGVYTGSIGYFSGKGDFDFNIAIRTLIFHQGKIDLQLGGAIGADSEPELEYQETIHKGASIFQVLGYKHPPQKV